MHLRAPALPILALANLGTACGGARADLPTEDGARAIDGGGDGGGGADAAKAADAASTDARSIDAASTDAADGASACALPVLDPAACNAVPDAPSMITSTCSLTSAPPATGGKVEDGTYLLDSMTYFGTCPAAPDVEADSWTICGSEWDTRQETGVPSVVRRIDTTASFAGAVVTVSIHCIDVAPSTGTPSGSEVWGYDATPGRLVLHVPVMGGQRFDAYVKR
jgi:hypothetical protein